MVGVQRMVGVQGWVVRDTGEVGIVGVQGVWGEGSLGVVVFKGSRGGQG